MKIRTVLRQLVVTSLARHQVTDICGAEVKLVAGSDINISGDNFELYFAGPVSSHRVDDAHNFWIGTIEAGSWVFQIFVSGQKVNSILAECPVPA